MVDADIFVLLDHVQLDHRGFTRKVEFPEQTLSVPINKHDKFIAINKVRIDESQPWRRKHFRFLQMRYTGSHFPARLAVLKGLMEYNPGFLIDLNSRLLMQIKTWLKIGTPTFWSSDLGIESHGRELIRDIIDLFGADTYVTGSSWSKYIPPEMMEDITIMESSYRDKRPVLDLVFGGERVVRDS